jgi:hypothetical protein
LGLGFTPEPWLIYVHPGLFTMNSSQNPDRVTNQFSFTIVISVEATSFILAGLLTLGFWSSTKKDDDRNAKTWEFGRDAIGLAAAISGAVYAFQSVRQGAIQQEESLLQSARQHEITLQQSAEQQLQSARQHEITLQQSVEQQLQSARQHEIAIQQSAEQQHRSHSIDITREYINLWDEEPFARARVTVSELDKELNGDTEDRYVKLKDLLKERPEAEQDVTLILNLLEKIALFREQNLLDEVLLSKFYKAIVLRSWFVLQFHVIERRNRLGSELYKNLEALHKEWSENP